MTKIVPIPYEWTGEVMCPLPRFDAQCTQQFIVGEIYSLDIAEQRSNAHQGFYFACLKSAWDSLPEDIAKRYPSVERLRRRALIKSGWCDERTVIFETEKDAKRASTIVQMFDEDAVVLVKGNVLHIFTAKSQSYKSMGKADFRASCDAVLDEVSKLIGTDVSTLAAQTPRPLQLEDER